MKHRKYILPLILFLGFIFISFGFNLYIKVSTLNPESASTLGTLGDFLNPFISIVNLIAIIYLTYTVAIREDERNEENRISEEREKERNREHELIMQREMQLHEQKLNEDKLRIDKILILSQMRVNEGKWLDEQTDKVILSFEGADLAKCRRLATELHFISDKFYLHNFILIDFFKRGTYGDTVFGQFKDAIKELSEHLDSISENKHTEKSTEEILRHIRIIKTSLLSGLSVFIVKQMELDKKL